MDIKGKWYSVRMPDGQWELRLETWWMDEKFTSAGKLNHQHIKDGNYIKRMKYHLGEHLRNHIERWMVNRTMGKRFEPTIAGFPVLVIAGTLRQYDDWVREQRAHGSRVEFIPVTREDKLRGLNNVEIIHIGTWHRNKVTHSDIWYRLSDIGFKPRADDDYGRVVIRR